MKKIILASTFFLILSVSLFSQNKVFVDDRIKSTYSEETINYLLENNIDEIKWLNWYLDNGYIIKNVGLEKCDRLPYLKYCNRQTKEIGENVLNIDFSDLNNFNVFLYNTECSYDKPHTYRIGDTGRILIIRGRKHLDIEYKKFLSDEN